MDFNRFKQDIVGKISQPTLVLWGEKDFIIPIAWGEELARRIPDAEFALISGAGHMPQEINSQDVADHIRKFLNRLPLINH